MIPLKTVQSTPTENPSSPSPQLELDSKEELGERSEQLQAEEHNEKDKIERDEKEERLSQRTHSALNTHPENEQEPLAEVLFGSPSHLEEALPFTSPSEEPSLAEEPIVI